MEYVEVLHQQRIGVLDHIHRLELEEQTDENDDYIGQLDDELMMICFQIDDLAATQ